MDGEEAADPPGAVPTPVSVPGAGAFVMHVASSCALAANGSEQGFDFTLVFNKNPLVCYEPSARFFYPCHWGLLHGVATVLAILFNNSTLVQRVEARRQACHDLAPRYWAQTALRRTPPQVRVVPTPLTNVPDAVLLTCHVWGFYPPEVTIQWLHNGDVVASGDTAKLLPAGDWTYQTQVALTATTTTGDTYTCSVQHASLEQPLRENWSPGLSHEMTVMVAVAATIMTVGLVVLAAGTFVYCHQPRAWGILPHSSS
ncbi:HLA class II histocompatibility antigen, DM beta chain-like [Cygnus atratus]|uniref:HLA class II histocompatibility antigen, DM beta chain-like n=1 Tax=Cygnus atratus TaxID=8868 RepID=UPI0021B7FEAF|nr:HLA class II histocompatibility antigen, DM beta chain-like [Cygnus atratus]